MKKTLHNIETRIFHETWSILGGNQAWESFQYFKIFDLND